MTLSPPTADLVRAVLAEVLDEPVDALDDQDDLLERGLDSIRMMTVTERFREHGRAVALVDLVENPTVAGWTRLLADAPAADG